MAHRYHVAFQASNGVNKTITGDGCFTADALTTARLEEYRDYVRQVHPDCHSVVILSVVRLDGEDA